MKRRLFGEFLLTPGLLFLNEGEFRFLLFWRLFRLAMYFFRRSAEFIEPFLFGVVRVFGDLLRFRSYNGFLLNLVLFTDESESEA